MAVEAVVIPGSTPMPPAARPHPAVAFLRAVIATRGALFGLGVVLLIVLIAVFADQLAPYPVTRQDPRSVLKLPTGNNWLGTDELGRDILSRLIVGSRPSLEAGLISVGIALLIGVPMGLCAGYLGGWFDSLIMRFADALWAFPGLVLALAVEAVLGKGFVNAMIAIGIVYAPVFARLTRSQTLLLRELDFVQAANALGARRGRILLNHIWPNVAALVIVQASLMLGQAIIFEAALSFLGLGVQPPEPAWGSMLRTAYQYIQIAPWYSVIPGLAIFFSVLGFNLLGDGIRAALDPTLRRAAGARAVGAKEGVS